MVFHIVESIGLSLIWLDDDDMLIESIRWSPINFHSTLSLISHTLVFILTTQPSIVSGSFPGNGRRNPPSPSELC